MNSRNIYKPVSFRTFLESEKKTKFSVFDFDGTLALVPTKPLPGTDYKGWDGRNWWGSKESLTPPEEGGFYDGRVNKAVVEAFKRAKADPHTETILLTGRQNNAAHLVRRVMRDNGLHGKRMIGFNNPNAQLKHDQNVATGLDVNHPAADHEEYFNGDHHHEPDYPKVQTRKGIGPDTSTIAHKTYIMEKKINENGGYDVVELWDDREEHMELFRQFGQRMIATGKVGKFIIHKVILPLDKDRNNQCGCKNMTYIDKIKHFLAGIAITTLSFFFFYLFGHPKTGVSVGVSLSILAGIAKEIYDVNKGFIFDKYDMLATWAGGFVAAAIILCFL